MAVILTLSSDVASAEQTNTLLERVLRRLTPDLFERLRPEHLQVLNVALRKTGHFMGYLLLGMLTMRAVRAWRGRHGLADVALGWIAAAVWAGIDEGRQHFLQDRTGSLDDVLLDSLGALTGVILFTFWVRVRYGR
jgi:VanZ family protein